MSGRDYKIVICSKKSSSIWSSGLNELSYGKLAKSVSQKVPQGFCSISEHWENRIFLSTRLFLLENAALQLKNASLRTLPILFVKVPKISPKGWKW